MTFNLGLTVVRRFCEEQQPLDWFRAKLTATLFTPIEQPVFAWVDAHVKKHHQLPHLSTLSQQFPEVQEVGGPEPASYYVDLLEKRFGYQQINAANLDSQKLLKDNQHAYPDAMKLLTAALNRVTLQQYRTRIMDFAVDAPMLLLNSYHKLDDAERAACFGWPYLDVLGGAMPGDIVSFVGRPAAGKSWLSLRIAIRNWQAGHNVLFVSMEMNEVICAQRAASMMAGTSFSQLKSSGYSTPTYQKFYDTLQQVMGTAADAPKLFIVNGQLAADAEDVYALAAQLGCTVVVVDGAYLLRHKNLRLDRYARAAENCEAMKSYSEELLLPTFASWQLNREATKKKKAHQDAGLEDIAYSDTIPQISSIVIGLFQEDGVETMLKRILRLMKGRSGETGQFEIWWDFDSMNFDQIIEDADAPKKVLEFI